MEFEGVWLESSYVDGTIGRVKIRAGLEKTIIPDFYTLRAADVTDFDGETIGLWGSWDGGILPDSSLPLRRHELLTDRAISTAEVVIAGSLATITVAFATPSESPDPASGRPAFTLPTMVYTFDISKSNPDATFSGVTTASPALSFQDIQLLLNGKGTLRINQPGA